MVVALIVVGPGKLPEVAAAIGRSVREFQKATSGITDTVTGAMSGATAPPANTPQPMQPPHRPSPTTRPARHTPAPANRAGQLSGHGRRPGRAGQLSGHGRAQAAPVNYPVMGAAQAAPAAPAAIAPASDPLPNPTEQQPPS